LTQDQKDLLLYFLLRVLALPFRSMRWVRFCIWYEIGSKIIVLHVDILSLVERLLPLNCLETLIKNHLTINIRVYFWNVNSISLIYRSTLMPVLYCLHYCS
jgi:hypothetical protein